MLTPTQRQDLIGKIKTLPDQLEAAVAGLTDEQLDTPYGEGKWTVRQVVHHLADAHCSAILRFKKTITEDNPWIMSYPQDEFAQLLDYTLPIDVSLAIIRGLHLRWSYTLEQVDDSAWERTAQHEEAGEITLDWLLDVYGKHGEDHLKQITGLLNAKGWR